MPGPVSITEMRTPVSIRWASMVILPCLVGLVAHPGGGERSDGGVQFALGALDGPVGGAHVLLDRGASLRVGQGGAHCVDHDTLGDLGRDGHVTGAVARGRTAVDRIVVLARQLHRHEREGR